MTKPSFPSKQEIYSLSTRMRVSLGLRVLLLAFICIILPLVAYVVVIWQDIKLAEDRELFEQIAHVTDAQKNSADCLLREAFIQIQAARILVAQTTDKETLRRNFQEIVAGFPGRMLCIATQGQDDNLDIKMSSEILFEGHFLTAKNPIALPLRHMFVFFCYCPGQQMGSVGLDLPSGEKLLLVFPGESLVQIPPAISDWAGSMGVELLQDDATIVQRPPVCSANDCIIYSENEVHRILDDDEDTPRLENKLKLAELAQLDTVPLFLRVNIPPILYQTSYGQFLYYLALIILLIVIFGAIATWVLMRHMIRPYEHLATLMIKAGNGDLGVRYQHQYMGFEINILGEHFNKMLEALKESVEMAKKEHAAREKLQHECAIGHNIQKAIFPRMIPRLPQFDIAASFMPASEVTGDFYDLFPHDSPQGKRLLIAIGDASGRGIAACLYSFLLRSMLRSFAASGDSLEKIIEHANDLFCLDTEAGGMFVTVWMGMVNLADNSLNYASLGHYPALFKNASGSVVELDTKGSAFGVPFTEPIVTKTVQLQKNDLLFLYTDGWIETKRYGASFNRSRLVEMIGKLPPEASSKQVLTALEKALLAEDESTEDDRTALVFRHL